MVRFLSYYRLESVFEDIKTVCCKSGYDKSDLKVGIYTIDEDFSIREKMDGSDEGHSNESILGQLSRFNVTEKERVGIERVFKGLVDMENQLDLTEVAMSMMKYSKLKKRLADCVVEHEEAMENEDIEQVKELEAEMDDLTSKIKDNHLLKATREISSIEDCMDDAKSILENLKEGFMELNRRVDSEFRDTRKSLVIETYKNLDNLTNIYVSDVPLKEVNKVDEDVVRTIITSDNDTEKLFKEGIVNHADFMVDNGLDIPDGVQVNEIVFM